MGVGLRTFVYACLTWHVTLCCVCIHLPNVSMLGGVGVLWGWVGLIIRFMYACVPPGTLRSTTLLTSPDATDLTLLTDWGRLRLSFRKGKG